MATPLDEANRLRGYSAQGLTTTPIDEIVMEGDRITTNGRPAAPNPTFTPETTSDRLAREGAARAQAQSRAASRAAYAAPEAPSVAARAQAGAAAGVERARGAAAGAVSRLRNFPGQALRNTASAAGRAITPVAAAAGAAQSFMDQGNGYKEAFDQVTPFTVGRGGRATEVFGDNAVTRGLDAVDDAALPVIDSVGQNAIRVMSNVGNALTGGLAERTGRGLSSAASGRGFSEGFNMPTLRDRTVNPTTAAPAIPGAPAAAATGRQAQGSISINGVPLSNERMLQLEDRGRTSGIDFGAGSGGNTNPIANALRDALSSSGRGNSQAVGAVIANPANDPFNKLASDVRSLHGNKAPGTLARKLMQIEEMRQQAQSGERANQTALSGQALDSADRQAAIRANLLNTAADYDVQSQAAQASRLRAQLEGAGKAEEKGFERFNKLTDGLFQTTGEDGKAAPDLARQEQFRAFVFGTDPREANTAMTQFMELTPQAQAARLQELRTAFEIQQERNAGRGGMGGMQVNTLDAPVEQRDAALSDVFGRGLSATDYLYSNLPFTDPNVVVGESGQAQLRSDAVGDNAERQRYIEQSLRSRLRNP